MVLARELGTGELVAGSDRQGDVGRLARGGENGERGSGTDYEGYT